MDFFNRSKKYIAIAAVFGTFTASYVYAVDNKPNAYEVMIGDKVVAYINEDKNSLDAIKALGEEVEKRFTSVKFKEELVLNKVKITDDYLTSEKDLKKTVLQNSGLEVDSCSMLSNGKEIGVVASEAEGNQVLDKIKNYYASKSEANIKESKLKNNITYTKKKSFIFNVDSIDMVADRVKEYNSKAKNPVVAFELKGTLESKETIMPTTTVSMSDSVPAGQSKVQSKGEEGQKVVVKEVTLENNKAVNTKVISEKIIKQPQNRVVLQGKKNTAVAGSIYLSTPSRGAVSSPFGMRWGRMHEGLDIAANMGEPIYAAFDGTVTYAAWESGYGNFIKLKHADGLETAYGHCSKIDVKVGDTVKKGEKIGEVGNTGNSTGPHLHFEVRMNGVAKDPTAYLK